MSPAPWSRAVRWPLWSWRNLVISAAVALAVMAALGRITGGQGVSAAAPLPPASTAVPTVPTPTGPETSVSTTASVAPSASTGGETSAPAYAHSPVTAASAFATAWVHTTGGAPAWLAGMKPWATASLLASLDGTDPRQVPASRVTGDAALLKTTGTSATVSVPTDGGRIAISMIPRAGSWKANALAPDDAPPGAPTPSLEPSQSPTGN